MFKLYKYFNKRDWIGIVFIVGLTVLQVWLTMTMIDYIQGIIKAITYVNYHNNPETLEFGGQTLKTILDTYGGWDAIRAMAPAMGEYSDAVISICDATVADIWFNGGMMIAIAAGLMLVQAIISLIASMVAADLSTNIRTELYYKVEGYSLAEINQFSTPSLITRTTNDIQHVQMANLMTFRMIFAAPITAVWAIIKVNASSTELTIAVSISIILLLVFIMSMMITVLPKFRSMQKLTDNLNGVTRENLTGIRIIRAFNAEEYQEKKFTTANNEFTNAQMFAGKVMSLMSPVMMIIMNGISLAIYWIGADLINKQAIDYATVTSFMTLSSQIIMSFLMLMMLFVIWPRASVAAKRINEALATVPSILDPEVEEEMTEVGTLEFKNVTFNYPGSEESALSDISFKANKGETVAIIGATGSGKTTLVNLMPRLYDATSGEVLVDGVNVKNVKQSTLRDKIGYVPQKGFLFSGSIMDNIRLGNTDMSLESVKESARIACANEFVEALDDEYDYNISQGGKNVSGGQRQRLCIARAVAKKPEILIFDDSFSALDYKTDKKVRDNLKESLKDCTKIIVAQRIGTILDADKILVIEDGKIVGEGKHEELLASSSVYKEIALSQLTKEELGL